MKILLFSLLIFNFGCSTLMFWKEDKPKPVKYAVEVKTTLKNDSQEIKARNLLHYLFRSFPLDTYNFTDEVTIESHVHSRAFPKLRLNTDFVDDPDLFLSWYLHYQFHWYLNSKNSKYFVKDIKEKIPNLRDYEYFLLAANFLEYNALIQVHDGKRALDILGKKRKNKDLYEVMLSHYQIIKNTLSKHEMLF